MSFLSCPTSCMTVVMTDPAFRRAVVRTLAITALAAASRIVPAKAAATTLSFAGLYGPVAADGIQLTPAAQALVGKRVRLGGFMAPPLKAESDFFVLTR